jgi:hypothetical protein
MAASLPSAPMSHIPCILDLAAGNADVLQCAVVDRLLAARYGGSHARGAFSTTARRRWRRWATDFPSALISPIAAADGETVLIERYQVVSELRKRVTIVTR